MTFRLIKIVHLRGRYRPGDAFVKINKMCPNVSSNINILSPYFRGDSFVKKHYVNEKSLMFLQLINSGQSKCIHTFRNYSAH